MPLFNINDALAYLDNKRRVAWQNAKGLLGDGGDTANQLASQTAEDAKSGLLNLGQDAQTARKSAIPQLRQEAIDRTTNALVNAGGLLAPTVYHGTPHTVSSYDLSKVGTGQGAQAYGHGIYFAENPVVAQSYQTALSRYEMVDGKGSVVWSPPKGGADPTPESRAANALQYAFDTQSTSPYQLAADMVRRTENKGDIAPAWETLSKWQENGVAPKPAGNTYTQELPDSVLPRMLQWDKPLSEQPQPVQQALRAADVGRFGDSANFPGDTGESLVSRLTAHNGPSGIADYFRSIGIPGLSYLDAGSRGGAPQFVGDSAHLAAANSFKSSGYDAQAALQGMRQAYKGASDSELGAAINEAYGLTPPKTMNHVIWDQDLLDQMTPQPYNP